MKAPIAPEIRLSLIALAITGVALTACTTLNKQADSCPSLQERNLEVALRTVQETLPTGCEARFDDYLAQLLDIAEGDPTPENKQRFSEFLVWTSEQGLLSKRQAQRLYNRYFNVKFVSLMGDYNNCSYTCPNRTKLLQSMEQELADKEQGLLKISLDKEGYYRADRLFKETELVLEATCSACGTVR